MKKLYLLKNKYTNEFYTSVLIVPTKFYSNGGIYMSNQEPKFYICNECNIIIEELQGKKGDFSCSGIALKELTANTSDGAKEKHLPVVKKDGNKITVIVGDVIHPMSEEHSIEWVYLQTEKGSQRMILRPEEEPAATFLLADGDRAIAAYAYCNLHGFWKTDI